ncbi:MAG: HEAT repeat domain-containing protein [Bryobacteraceae bacterium]
MLKTEYPGVEELPEWSVSEAVASYADDPQRLCRWMRETYERYPEAFRSRAVACLQRPVDGAGVESLVSFLVEQGLLAHALIHDERFRAEQRTLIAAQAVKSDPEILECLYDSVVGSDRDQRRLAMRLLRMLEPLLDYRHAKRLVLRLMRHPDAQVRSKAALLAGRLNRNPQWLAMQLYEQDARLRANAVEAFWGTQAEECTRLMWQAVRGDTNCRVRANALYGIYLSSDPAVIPFILKLLGEGESERASAIWLIGRTADPRFLPLVENLWKTEVGTRRNPILQALTRIRGRMRELATGPTLAIVPSLLRHGEDGWRTLRLSVRGPDQREVSCLKPLEFVLEENHRQVGDYHLRETPSAAPLAAGFLVDEALGEWGLAALEQCVAESLPEDLWAVCSFTNGAPGDRAAPSPSGNAPGGVRLDSPTSCVTSLEPEGTTPAQAASAVAKALTHSGRETKLLFVLTRAGFSHPFSLEVRKDLAIHLMAPAGSGTTVAENVRTEWFSDTSRVPGLLAALYRDWRSNYEIRYQCDSPHWQTDSEICVTVYSPQGAGRALWTAE